MALASFSSVRQHASLRGCHHQPTVGRLCCPLLQKVRDHPIDLDWDVMLDLHLDWMLDLDLDLMLDLVFLPGAVFRSRVWTGSIVRMVLHKFPTDESSICLQVQQSFVLDSSGWETRPGKPSWTWTTGIRCSVPAQPQCLGESAAAVTSESSIMHLIKK